MRSRRGPVVAVVLATVLGCGSNSSEPSWPAVRNIEVLVVGASAEGGEPVPIEGASVLQGGQAIATTSDASGRATVAVDPSVEGEVWVVAALPGHRSAGVEFIDGWGEQHPVRIELDRVAVDNSEYFYGDPGVGGGADTEHCSHCHATLTEQFGRSAHRGSAVDPALNDLFEAGDDCADCHAPGADGPAVLRRDLGDLDGPGLTDGVHCDLCHKIADVRLDQPPGPGSRLVLGRPSEGPTGIWEFKPAMYGPYPDVLNPFMGGVYAPVFSEPRFCGGCHEYEQGGLPVQTTLSEFEATPLASVGAGCRDCHMPPVDIPNSADLERQYSPPGLAGGFARPLGAVRDHSFYGALDVGPSGRRLVEDAVSRLEVSARLEEGTVVADVAVEVAGGHAFPTGEPMRSVVLWVEVRACGESAQLRSGSTIDAVGGRAVPAVERTSPVDGGPVQGLEGAPGRAFARVLADASGALHVPHREAVREARDDRLRPGAPVTESFTFVLPGDCTSASVEAKLLYRRFPVELAARRGWDHLETVAAAARASVP